jgi:hypothetical protein
MREVDRVMIEDPGIELPDPFTGGPVVPVG